MKVHLFERIIAACVTVCSAITETNVSGQGTRRLECFDFETLIWSGQVVLSLSQLSVQMDAVFYGELRKEDSRHVLFDR